MGFKETLKKSCDTVKSSAKKLSDQIKTEHKKSMLKNELDDAYATLGKIRFSELNDGENAEIETQKICDEIRRIINDLNELEGADTKKCPSCGKDIENDGAFCQWCGAKSGEE